MEARLHACVRHALELTNISGDETIASLRSDDPSEAFKDARALSDAIALTIYDEARRPFLEFLTELDKSAVVRARPHLHVKLKELLR